MSVNGTEVYAVFHIGDAQEPGVAKNCSVSGEQGPPPPVSNIPFEGYNTFLTSPSIHGPWTPLGYSYLNGSLSWDPIVTNTAPWQLE